MKNIKKIIKGSAAVLLLGLGAWGTYALYQYDAETVEYNDLTTRVQVERSIPGHLAYSENKKAYYFYTENGGSLFAGPVLAPADYQDAAGQVISYDDPSFLSTLSDYLNGKVLYADYRIYLSENAALEEYRMDNEGLMLPRHFYQTPKTETYYNDHFVLM
jgi:hypothetical protein